MAAVYPSRWTPTMGESPCRADGSLTLAGDTWSRGLAGLNEEQVARGLGACITRAEAWPPTLPEFRALCLGIPSLMEVKADLSRVNAARMPFTVAVWRRIDPWSYRHAPEHVADRVLERAYRDTYEAVMRGEPLPQPLQALEAKEPPPPKCTPEVARAALAAARELLGITPAPKPDVEPEP